MTTRRRLDAELVRRKLVDSRAQAQAVIADRQVTVNGAIAGKAASLVAASDAVEVLAPPPRYVGRGGEKLHGALDTFGVDPTGLRCLDVGSSTGGFTDCLLQHGAGSVTAVDVGRAQLHDRLRRHPQVTVREQTDIRSFDVDAAGGRFDLVVIDVSFIGLDRILDDVVALTEPQGRIVALVKPQFEAGRSEADRGRGVIRDPDVWARVLRSSVESVSRRGHRVADVMVSPLKGGAGNVEFFLLIDGLAQNGDDGQPREGGELRSDVGNAVSDDVGNRIDRAIAAARELP